MRNVFIQISCFWKSCCFNGLVSYYHLFPISCSFLINHMAKVCCDVYYVRVNFIHFFPHLVNFASIVVFRITFSKICIKKNNLFTGYLTMFFGIKHWILYQSFGKYPHFSQNQLTLPRLPYWFYSIFRGFTLCKLKSTKKCIIIGCHQVNWN